MLPPTAGSRARPLGNVGGAMMFNFYLVLHANPLWVGTIKDPREVLGIAVDEGDGGVMVHVASAEPGKASRCMPLSSVAGLAGPDGMLRDDVPVVLVRHLPSGARFVQGTHMSLMEVLGPFFAAAAVPATSPGLRAKAHAAAAALSRACGLGGSILAAPSAQLQNRWRSPEARAALDAELLINRARLLSMSVPEPDAVPDDVGYDVSVFTPHRFLRGRYMQAALTGHILSASKEYFGAKSRWYAAWRGLGEGDMLALQGIMRSDSNKMRYHRGKMSDLREYEAGTKQVPVGRGPGKVAKRDARRKRKRDAASTGDT